MGEKIQLQAVVDDTDGGERLDAVAARVFPDYSRSRLQTWIKDGQLQVDGVRARPRDKVFPGALLTLDAETVPEVSWEAQSIELDIVHEDESIIVLNKPAGLVVHDCRDARLVAAAGGVADGLQRRRRAGGWRG